MHPDANVEDQGVDEGHIVVRARHHDLARRQQQPAAQAAQPAARLPGAQVPVHLRPGAPQMV